MQTAATETRKLTYDDFLLFPDDGRRHELIDGVHYVTPSPVLRHQEILGRIYFEVASYLRAHPEGRVYLAPLDVVMSIHDIVEPDLIFVAAAQDVDKVTPKNIQGAPALLVEILSPGTRRRDLGIKRDLYDRIGVREYWLIDPDRNTVTIHRRAADGSFPLVETLERALDSILKSPLLPGFSLDVSDLLA